ncbi:MAG: electron transport complex subunit RsxC [bacterium]
MKLFSFKGGVHPPEFKELTSYKAIKELPVPKKVIIPLQQHIGEICTPLVKEGQLVKKGQKIGSSDAFIASSIHASISGKVISIQPHAYPLGKPVQSITIESDGKDEWVDSLKAYQEYFRLLPQEVRGIVKEAGIVGLGGAAFPTHVKLLPQKDKTVDTVIINGCECEPYLSCDYQVMLKYTREIIDGIKILMKTLDASRAIIGIENNKPLALERMAKAVTNEPNVDVVGLKTKYPQGAEKHLIEAILKKRVPPGALPLDVGCVVHNVSTTLAIRNAIVKGMPLIERVVTVTGSAVAEPQNVMVRIGTLVSEVIENCGGYIKEPGKLIMGGPMMGFAQATDDVPVLKGTSGILVLSKKEVDTREETPCIKCSKCVGVCPMNLMPNMIVLYAKNRIWDKTEEYNIFDCMECGSCAYVCPAKIPLVHYIKDAKFKVTILKKRKTVVKKG